MATSREAALANRHAGAFGALLAPQQGLELKGQIMVPGKGRKRMGLIA